MTQAGQSDIERQLDKPLRGPDFETDLSPRDLLEMGLVENSGQLYNSTPKGRDVWRALWVIRKMEGNK